MSRAGEGPDFDALEIERLRAENARLLRLAVRERESLRAELAASEQARAEAEKDTARLDWFDATMRDTVRLSVDVVQPKV